MYLLKSMFKILIILPLLALSSCVIGGSIARPLTGGFNWWVAVIAALIVSIGYILLDGKSERARFKNHITSLGVNPEYLGGYLDNVIAIDKTNEKVFVGTIKQGKVLGFSEISSIEWEDYPVGNNMKYLIHVNTRDFDLPKISVGFAGNRGSREQAYAKLRAALNIR